MTFAKKIKDEIMEDKNNLFKSFFPNSKYSFNFQSIKKFNNFQTVVVIGMGGSILGTKAIYSFLKHKIKKKFIFIDNLDQGFLSKIKQECKLAKTLFLIVSKSGNTNETIINSSYFKFFFKKSNIIIISENKNNILYKFAKSKGFDFVKHNPFIGGRYSVFSEVGMLPAYLMGLNLKNFKKNLPKFLNSKKILSNSIKQLLKIQIKKFKVVILFNYVPELNDFLFWLQQLLAESLGKKKKGFMPVVSNAPKDHHSLLQLYLDGPKDKIFYVFSSKSKKNLKLNCDIFGKEISYLNKKSYQDVKVSQKNAFIEILKKNRTPFREVVIKKFDENTLGKLFLLFIFETIALGKMMKIDPFDQPAVEKVKVLTKKFLISKKSSKKNF
jgi:glucose-6-phosphate isomerase